MTDKTMEEWKKELFEKSTFKQDDGGYTLIRTKDLIEKIVSLLHSQSDRQEAEWVAELNKVKDTASKSMGKNPIADNGLELLVNVLDDLISKYSNKETEGK
jgi:hypothetical protein